MTHALLFHLLSLVIFSAGALGSLITFLTFRQALHKAPATLPGVASMFPRFGIMAEVGVLLMVISGLFLMSTRGWGDWGATWLSLKLALVVLLFLNAQIFGKPTGMRMGKALAAGGVAPGDNPEVARAVQTLTLFYAVQITGLIAIISLAVLGPR